MENSNSHKNSIIEDIDVIIQKNSNDENQKEKNLKNSPKNNIMENIEIIDDKSNIAENL